MKLLILITPLQGLSQTRDRENMNMFVEGDIPTIKWVK